MSFPSTGSVVLTVIAGSLVYGLFVFIPFYLRIRQRNRHLKKFPCRPTHWLLGNLHEFPGPNEKGLVWMKKMAEQFSEGFTIIWFGPFFPGVNVFHPDSVKLILQSSEPKPLKVGGYFNVRPWLGDGLLLAGGKKWERNRRLLTRAFHFDILRPYMKINNRCTDILIDKLEKFAERKEHFEVFTHISLLTLDVILRCAFSYDNDCQLRGKPWLFPDFIFYLTPLGRKFRRDCDFVHSVSDEIIRNRKAALEILDKKSIEKNRCLNFLDILLTARDSDGQGLTDQEIRDEADTFLFEGHDTTSSGISWTLYSLAKYPEHLKRCQEEVDEVLKGKSNKDIDYDDLPKLNYLTKCIKESLRMHTAVPFIQRETTKDMTMGGRHVPAGTMFNINIYCLHHIKEVWNNPEEYRPDRFSPENLQNMDPFAFCPFSAGPRNCIGQQFAMHEMKTVIAKIINRFDISLDPNKEVRHRLALVMKAEDGIYMKATPRK